TSSGTANLPEPPPAGTHRAHDSSHPNGTDGNTSIGTGMPRPNRTAASTVSGPCSPHSTHKPRNRKVQATPPATESPLESVAESSFTRARKREELHVPARESPECNASSVYAPAAARPGRDGGRRRKEHSFRRLPETATDRPQGTPCQGNHTAVSIRRNVTTVR